MCVTYISASAVIMPLRMTSRFPLLRLRRSDHGHPSHGIVTLTSATNFMFCLEQTVIIPLE